MAGRRWAIELAIGEEDLAALGAIARSRTDQRAGLSERGCCWPTGKTDRFLRWGEPWARTIRPSSAVSSGRWPMARRRRSTIDRGPAGRRRSPPRPKHGLSTSPAARPRTSAIPTNCGQRGFWPAMRVSMGRRRATPALPSGSGNGVQYPQRAGDQAAQGPLLPGTPRSGVQAEDGGGSCVYREVKLIGRARPLRATERCGGDCLLR